MEHGGPKSGKRSARASVLDQRPEYARLGAWIREQREAKGLLQKPLSRALGKPEQFLNKVEAGRQRIDVVEFLDLLAALDIDGRDALVDLVGIRAINGRKTPNRTEAEQNDMDRTLAKPGPTQVPGAKRQ